MTKIHVKLFLLLMFLLALAAFLIPASPFFLLKFRDIDQERGGHSKSHWLDKLNSPDKNARLEAIRAIGNFGAEASDAVPILATFMLDESDLAIRKEATLALTKITAPMPESKYALSQSAVETLVPAFAKALEDKEPIVRINAGLGLSHLGKDARPALPALIKAIKDKDNDTNAKSFHFTIQEIAALSIARATAATADGVPVLLEALSSAAGPDMRRTTARALGEVGPEARSAIPALRKLLKEKNTREVKEAAEIALKAIGADPESEKKE